ncbi:hypothetical protein BWL13_01993 [Microbacterium oleivorans]|uniref:hypothetical protein n=1 Tax=Microbacterium oleivorans TaxID=273677 RepID=UPI00097557B9|nr:hypothetical protein [Microbacterium oleivorans]AZS44405.1 hypothetical protein BWL13_01993 [Microbacterium oleivorans]
MSGDLRWSDYVLASIPADNEDVWAVAATRGTTLLLCAAGFDPRTLDVPSGVRKAVDRDLTVIAVRPNVAGEHDSAQVEARVNVEKLGVLFADALHIVDVPQAEDPATTGALMTRQLQESFNILAFDSVIIDISAFPSSLYFPLIRLFLQQSKTTAEQDPRFLGNLIVSVSEDPSTDDHIVPTGLAPASILSGFERMPEDDGTRIWIPILGAGANEELDAVQRLIHPHEVCPVVPFPARDARRADDLILEHQTLLRTELTLDTRNILYASESNPFDLYRQLVELTRRYTRALSPLGEVTVIASEHASKTLSLGLLLAADEVPIVVVEVRPSGYMFESSNHDRLEPSVSSLWLTGQPYEVSVVS